MSIHRSRRATLAAAVFASLAASCSEPQLTPTSASDTTTTTTTTTTTISDTGATDPKNILFSSQLEVGGARFYSFTVATAGVTTITLESLTSAVNPSTPAPAVSVGLGTPSGTGCVTDAPVITRAGAEPQISQELAVGTYCARIADAGTLSEPVLFDLHIVLP